MQVVGFNFTKVSAEKATDFEKGGSINTHIEFTDQHKEKSELIKDKDITKLIFKYAVNYEDKDKKERKQGEITFEGILLLSTEKDETKNFQKSWKKKEIPKEFTASLYNFILKRCSIKALHMEDDIGLPAHLPLPQVRRKTS